MAYWIEKPEAVTSDEAGELSLVLREYPYFQAARTVWVNHLKDRESLQFKDALSALAAHTTQREVLHSFFNDHEFPQHETARKLRNNETLLQHVEVVDAQFIDPQGEHPAEEWDKDLPEKILSTTLFEEKKEITPPPQNTPVSIDKNQKLSFEDWIKYTVKKELPLPDKISNESTSKDKNKLRLDHDEKFALIDQFIRTQPKIGVAHKAESISPIHLRKPVETEMMTETLAKLYFSQKKYKKALKAYKILCLKYPEKSSYFADQIRAIELEIKS